MIHVYKMNQARNRMTRSSIVVIFHDKLSSVSFTLKKYCESKRRENVYQAISATDQVYPGCLKR